MRVLLANQNRGQRKKIILRKEINLEKHNFPQSSFNSVCSLKYVYIFFF